MKITNTHFILGTILFVVIMISLTTSCCDFMPYSRQRGSLGMSVYEGMDGEGDEEEKKKTQEGLEGDEEEKKEGMEGDEEKMKKLLEDEKMKKLFEDANKKEGGEGDKKKTKEGLEGEEEEKKEGFGNAFGWNRNKNRAFDRGAEGSKSAFGGADTGNSGSLGGGRSWGGGGRSWGGGGGEFVAVQGLDTSGQTDNLLSIQRRRGFRKPGQFETMTNQTEPSPMSALAQSVFGSSVPWTN